MRQKILIFTAVLVLALATLLGSIQASAAGIGTFVYNGNSFNYYLVDKVNCGDYYVEFSKPTYVLNFRYSGSTGGYAYYFFQKKVSL